MEQNGKEWNRMERDRKRERGRDRDIVRVRQRERQSESETKRETEWEWDIERDRVRVRHNVRERQWQRQRDRKREGLWACEVLLSHCLRTLMAALMETDSGSSTVASEVQTTWAFTNSYRRPVWWTRRFHTHWDSVITCMKSLLHEFIHAAC